MSHAQTAGISPTETETIGKFDDTFRGRTASLMTPLGAAEINQADLLTGTTS